MNAVDQARVQDFLKENDPEARDKTYEEEGFGPETRAQLWRLNEALCSRSPEEILNHLNGVE